MSRPADRIYRLPAGTRELIRWASFGNLAEWWRRYLGPCPHRGSYVLADRRIIEPIAYPEFQAAMRGGLVAKHRAEEITDTLGVWEGELDEYRDSLGGIPAGAWWGDPLRCGPEAATSDARYEPELVRDRGVADQEYASEPSQQ
jgi:hypothetical protein